MSTAVTAFGIVLSIISNEDVEVTAIMFEGAALTKPLFEILLEASQWLVYVDLLKMRITSILPQNWSTQCKKFRATCQAIAQVVRTGW